MNKLPYLPLCTSYMIRKRAQAVERVSDGKIIMLGYPTCGKEKDGMLWTKLYIPSTIKTWKKLHRKCIWADKNGLFSGRLLLSIK